MMGAFLIGELIGVVAGIFIRAVFDWGVDP